MIVHRLSVMFTQCVARVNTHDVCFHATCESRRTVECTLICAHEANGIGVAVAGYVTRIRFSSRDTQRRDSGSQVLLTAGPIRQRAATADAPRGDYLRLAPGVGTLTPPPVMPTFVQDDGRFRFSAEPFIVFRSAPRGDRHS